MDDCISREAVEQFAREQKVKETGAFSKGLNKGMNIIISALRDGHTIPAADVRPVVRGKWEKHEDFDTYGGGRFVEWVCSECDKRLRGDWVIRNSHIEETPTENYCPNCGADMRGDR